MVRHKYELNFRHWGGGAGMNQSHWTMMDEKDVGDLMLNNGKNTSSVSKLPKNGRQDVGVTKDDDFFC